MATTVVSTKLKLDIGNFKSKMQDAKKSIEDLHKSFKSAGGNSWDPFKSTDLGKKIDDIKTKAGNLGETFKALPGPVKAGAVIIAVTASLKKLYDLGKQRFFEGLLDIKDTISPVLNGITTAINTVKQAFTEITGFNFNFTSIITTGVNFEAQMKKVATIAGSIGTELNQLISKARELGAATTFSATEVGEAMQYMAMAGWSTSEMLEGVQSTLNLAKIGSTDLGIASDILTDDLTALGMGANQAGDFADKLAATITRSNTDVVLFGESMKQTGAVAGALGASMTDLSTSIGLMANAGIKGSKAGMSLKNLFTNMANPTDKMSAALEKLGMTADKSGSYLKTTADGYTDLEATVASLRKGTENMTRSQKASLIATVAGKNALPGVMSLVNASAEEYNKLSEAIDNSTSTVSMFNENMNIIGLKGKQSSERIDMLKGVFNETELSATALGLSSKDLGYSISLLGNDSKVASKDVEGLLDIVDSMDNAGGKVDKFWRNVGNAKDVKIDGKSINQLIDYNSTIGSVQNSTVGLSDATKENYKEKGVAYERTKEYVQSLIKENMTVDEANKALKQYGLSAEKISLSTLSMSQKTDYLRQAFKGMSKEQIKAKLDTIGLGESFNEVNEIVGMSDDKYNKYKENLKTIQGLSDRMAKSIDETTKSTFFALSSAMEDTLLGAFDRLKPALLSGSEALTKFFSTWRGGDDGNYTFSGFEKGLNDLESKVAQASNNIPSLMDNMFSGINRFIKGGALDSFLNMGTDIIQNIAKGITDNAESISSSISSFIGKTSRWITDNMPALIEGGKVILEGIKKGVEENQEEINKAMDVIIDAMSAWMDGKNQLDALCGKFADKFIRLAVENFKSKAKGMATEFWNALTSGNTTSKAEDSGGKILFGDWNPVEDTKKWFKDKFENFNLWQWVKDTFFKKTSGLSQDGGKLLDTKDLFGDWHPIEDIKKWIDNTFGHFNLFKTVKEKLLTGNTTSKAQDSGGVPFKIEDMFKDFHPIEDFKNWVDKTFGEFDLFETIKEKLFENKKSDSSKKGSSNTSGGEVTNNLLGDWNPVEDTKKWVEEKFRDFNFFGFIKEKLFTGNTTSKAQDSGNATFKLSDLFGDWNPVDDVKKWIDGLQADKDGKVELSNMFKLDSSKMQGFKSEIDSLINKVKGSSTSIENMVNRIRVNMVNMSNIVRNQTLNCTNITRTQFVNLTNIVRSQCVNQANIVRNQFTSISNVVRNQSQNARNSATTSFISMSKVISTQCTNARTAVVSKMMSINAVVNTQAWKARDNATRAFMSLAAVVRSQMSNALSSVRNAMSQIASATNRTLTTKVNISKTITTTNVAKSIQAKPQTFSFSAVRSIQPRSFSLAATRSLGGINSLATSNYGSPSTLASTNSRVSSGSTTYGGTKGTTKTNSKPVYFDISIPIDGKEIAKASAKYMDGELKIINNRNNRKKGV